MDVPSLQPMSFLAGAVIDYVDRVNLTSIHKVCELRVHSLASELPINSAYSNLLVYCTVVANSAIADGNVHAVWQALTELHRVSHGNTHLPESMWHTWRCTFNAAAVCDLACFPSNLGYDCGLGGTSEGVPSDDALLDLEQLACAQQAYFAQVGMTHMFCCKPQSSHELLEAFASIGRLRESGIPVLTSNPPLAHGIVSACLQGIPLGFTFLWRGHFRCIMFLPRYKYIMVVDPYGPSRFPDGLMKQLQYTFHGYNIADASTPLQDDSINCGYWCMFIMGVMSRYLHCNTTELSISWSGFTTCLAQQGQLVTGSQLRDDVRVLQAALPDSVGTLAVSPFAQSIAEGNASAGCTAVQNPDTSSIPILMSPAQAPMWWKTRLHNRHWGNVSQAVCLVENRNAFGLVLRQMQAEAAPQNSGFLLLSFALTASTCILCKRSSDILEKSAATLR